MIVINENQDLARQLLSLGRDAFDNSPDAEPLSPAEAPSGAAALAADLGLQFPAGKAPVPVPLNPRPAATDKLPEADVLVVTWTVAENDGLADVLTPGFSRKTWNFYSRRFTDHYLPLIREGAPSRQAKRLGSYFVTKVGTKKVVCFKSELHLNQDGINLKADGVTPSPTKTGRATLPVKDLFKQMIEEVKPKLVITTGTSGGVFGKHALGDVVVTRGAKFRLADEFKNEPFNHIDKTGPQYTSDWAVPTAQFAKAQELMAKFTPKLKEPNFAPPTKRYPFPGAPITAPANTPEIRLDGTGGLPKFHPILTTDFFEFGTSKNKLEEQGCAVEMGDAVLGLVCSEMQTPPNWLVVRNLSDPQINGDLPTKPSVPDMQAHWAVWYYEQYGYWTSVTGALACWAVIAGL